MCLIILWGCPLKVRLIKQTVLFSWAIPFEKVPRPVNILGFFHQFLIDEVYLYLVLVFLKKFVRCSVKTNRINQNM